MSRARSRRTRSGDTTDGHADRRLLHRAAWAMAWRAAVLVIGLLVVVGTVVLGVEERQQHRQAASVARTAVDGATGVADVPAGTWAVLVTDDGRRLTTAGSPAGLVALDPRATGDGASVLHAGDTEYEVWTGTNGLGRMSAAFDLTAYEAEERRLLVSLGVAALVGALGAVALAWTVGRQAVRPLGEALALQRRFVADVSHELRTPLAVLTTRAQLLQRRTDHARPAELQAELAELVVDAHTLSDVVDDVLLSAELDHRPGHAAPADLRAVAAEVVASMGPLANARGVRLDMAAGSEPAVVAGVPTALRRAAVALVHNAIAHAGEGGSVRLAVAATGANVTLSVTDDGDGVDAAELPRLVRRFARSTPADAGVRVGIGLALVDEIARRHGGSLSAASGPGGGATFSLVLPGLPESSENHRAG